MVERSKAQAFDRGDYARGWKAEVEDQAGSLAVVLFNQRPHAAVIERGRRPGARRPPTKALVPWVRRKLKVSASEALGIAFVVARKIGERGIPGKFVMARARGAVIKLILDEIHGSLQRELAR